MTWAPGEGVAIDLAIDTLANFGRLRLKVTGTSMVPGLLPGDVVALERCDGMKVGVGELVLFRRERRLVIHRVLQATPSALITQGDGLARPDPPVAAGEVLGKVVGLRREAAELPARRRAGWRLRAGRLLFGHSNLATRIFLRWRRFTTRVAA